MSWRAVPVFRGRVNDRQTIDLESPAAFRAYLKGLKGRMVDLSVRKAQSQRSLKQNAWIWGVCYPMLIEKILEELGNDHHERRDQDLSDALHYDLLAIRFGTVAAAPVLLHVPPRIVPARTSSQLTTVEFADYMEWLVRYAAETYDVVIPLPDEETK